MPRPSLLSQYRYNLEDLVQLRPGGRVYRVVWRGTVWTVGGEILSVYWLGVRHWDAYYQEQLLPAPPGAEPPPYYTNQKDQLENEDYSSVW